MQQKIHNSPKKDDKSKILNNHKRDPFHDFENKTSDAWDDGDDDLISMATVQMSLKDVHSSARTVLENHSRQLANKHTSNSSLLVKPVNDSTHTFRHSIDEGNDLSYFFWYSKLYGG